MAEEALHPQADDQSDVLSRDDLSALEYVLEHVKGSSPTSVSQLAFEDAAE